MTKEPRKSASRRHAEVEGVTIFGTTVRLAPYGLIVFAEYYLLAARAVQAPEKAPDFPLVRTFLACHAVELALKAFLAMKGASLVELLGGPYGHNLKNLIEEAEKRDLQAFIKLDDGQRAEIIKASEYYSEKVLEYPSLIEAVFGQPNKMPNADVLIGVVDTMVSVLHEPCFQAE
jgi:hypothetical protein